MFTETIRILVEGRELDDIYPDLVSVEVELDDALPAMFRLRISLLLQEDGTWKHLDDARLRVWRKVEVQAGLDDQLEPLITGHITHVRPAFHADPTRCVLDVWGLDRSVLLDREDRRAAWAGRKDSDIATELFSSYGLSSTVEDTTIVHDEAVSTIVQRETDWQFLSRLARRNGFDCYVEGNMGHFESPRAGRAPQAVLAAHFGDETNVEDLTVEVNALTPAEVELCQLEPGTRDVLTASATTAAGPALGAVDAAPGAGIAAGRVVLGQAPATGATEMDALCHAVHGRQAWFVTARGTVAANRLGAVLRARATVTIKGVGKTYSGTYLVAHVTHAFSDDGYVQRFEAKRNGLEPTGAEDFTGAASGAGLLSGVL
jgi:phage protein D